MTRIPLLPLLAVMASAMAIPATGAVPAPRLAIASIDQLPQPLPTPYDEQADASAAVAAARAQAKRQHKMLLVDLGGNWCGDCRVLAAIMDLPDLKPFLARHFVIVTVNIGRYDKNGDIAAHYGFGDRLAGVPALLVVDPVRDRLINRDRIFALTDARHMTPQALADWLAQWM